MDWGMPAPRHWNDADWDFAIAVKSEIQELRRLDREAQSHSEGKA